MAWQFEIAAGQENLDKSLVINDLASTVQRRIGGAHLEWPWVGWQKSSKNANKMHSDRSGWYQIGTKSFSPMEAVARANTSHGFCNRVFALAVCKGLRSRVYLSKVRFQIVRNLKPLLRRNSGLLEGANVHGLAVLDAAAQEGFDGGRFGGREIGCVAYHGRFLFGVRQVYCAVPSLLCHGNLS